MTKRYYIIFIVTASMLNVQSFAQNQQLKYLLYSKQYPQLELALSKPTTPEEDKFIYRAFLLNAYNKPQESDNLLRRIIKLKIKADDDTIQFYLHRIAYDNKVKLNDYRAAFAASRHLLHGYSNFLDSTELQDLIQESEIWRLLINTESQKILAKEKAIIPIKHDLAGLWNIPVSIDDSIYDFVFDTGAGISTITETYAKKLKLDVIKNSSIVIRGGINGIATNARLGVAKKFRIQELIIQNAIFLIFPDSTLSFAGGSYKIKGIIGLPIIKALGEIIIQKDKMTIPLNKDVLPVRHNMILDLLKPVVYISFNGESLPCTFDCGAQTSLFSDNFYNRFKEDLKIDGKYDSLQIGGAGGDRTMKSVEMSVLNFSIANSPIQLVKAWVSLETMPVTRKYYYGNIGQDVINLFETTTINFLSSSISFTRHKD